MAPFAIFILIFSWEKIKVYTITMNALLRTPWVKIRFPPSEQSYYKRLGFHHTKNIKMFGDLERKLANTVENRLHPQYLHFHQNGQT